jgi:hypothetical protein
MPWLFQLRVSAMPLLKVLLKEKGRTMIIFPTPCRPGETH